jgi:hypothetical protein
LSAELSHDYELFDDIENSFDFEWQLDRIENDSICFKIDYDDPAIISRFGADSMNIELDFIGRNGVGLLDLFEFTEPDDPSQKLKKEDLKEPVEIYYEIIE